MTTAKQLLQEYPLLDPMTAISQISALLGIDWGAAELIYNSLGDTNV